MLYEMELAQERWNARMESWEDESRIRPFYELILARPEASPEEILKALSGPAGEE